MHTAYLTNILLVVKAVNNGTGAKEQYGLEKRVRTNMEESQLGLVKPNGNYHKS